MASHCQRNSKSNVVGYIKSKELSPDAPNFTVTSFGGHPRVKGNGYVPYYMVFDHTGKLIREHMCGQYHGGDGLAMIDWVDKALKDAPHIYLGEKEFTAVPQLAKQVASGKGLGAVMRKIEARLPTETDETAKAELERLQQAVASYRDRMLDGAQRLLGTRPARVVPRLKEIAKELKGSALAAAVEERIAAVGKSEELKRSVAIEKEFVKIRKGLDKRKGCDACKREGLKHFQLACARCRVDNKVPVARAKKRLADLIARSEGLPIAATLREYLGELQ